MHIERSHKMYFAENKCAYKYSHHIRMAEAIDTNIRSYIF